MVWCYYWLASGDGITHTKPALAWVGMHSLTRENDVARCLRAVRRIWSRTTLSVDEAHVYSTPLIRRDESLCCANRGLGPASSSKERSDAEGIMSLGSCCSSCPIQKWFLFVEVCLGKFLFVKGSTHLTGRLCPLLMWSLGPVVGCSSFLAELFIATMRTKGVTTKLT